MILRYECSEDHLASKRVFSGRFFGLVNNPGYEIFRLEGNFFLIQPPLRDPQGFGTSECTRAHC
jgi:hypothetical protein